jgi:hypothetical protein
LLGGLNEAVERERRAATERRAPHKAAIRPYSIAVAADAVACEATSVATAAASVRTNRVIVRIGISSVVSHFVADDDFG